MLIKTIINLKKNYYIHIGNFLNINIMVYLNILQIKININVLIKKFK